MAETSSIDPNDTDLRLAHYALREAMGYRRPLTVVAIAMQQHRHEISEQFGFLAHTPEAIQERVLNVIEDKVLEALKSFGVTEATLQRTTERQIKLLLKVFINEMSAGRLSEAATQPDEAREKRPEGQSGSSQSGSGQSGQVKAEGSPQENAATHSVPSTSVPSASVPTQAPASRKLSVQEPLNFGAPEGEVQVSQKTPSPVMRVQLGSVRRAPHAEQDQEVAAQQQVPSAAVTRALDFVWPEGSTAQDWQLRRHYLSLYLAHLSTSRRLGQVGREIGEARNTLARTLNHRVVTKHVTTSRLWDKLETRVIGYLRSHPEALRFGSTEVSSGEPHVAPGETGRSAEAYEYLLGDLIINARAVMDRREIARLLQKGGAERDLAERLASGMKHRALSEQEVGRLVEHLKTPAQDGRLRRAQAGQLWGMVSEVLQQTPMSKEVFVSLAANHQISLEMQDLRALQSRESVSTDLIDRVSSLLNQLSQEELQEARQRCYERVKDTDHPNPVALAWVREARDEMRQAMRRDAEGTRRRMQELGLSSKADQLEQTTHLSDSKLSITAGEAARIIKAVRPITSESDAEAKA